MIEPTGIYIFDILATIVLYMCAFIGVIEMVFNTKK